MPTVTGKGIDVSSWQGNYINWDEVKKAGYNFAIIPCRIWQGMFSERRFI